MEELKYYEQFYQCNECGSIHRSYIKKVKDLDNGVYYEAYCPKCKGAKKHLWVGQEESEIYEFYNPILDLRFYEQNKMIKGKY